jgi:polygalacturonase
VPPSFPDSSYKITDYGAVPGGEVLCTEAIREAIDQCHQNGGGRVIIPKGIFLTGPVHLKSNVNLHLADGATLLFSKDIKNYLPIVHARFEGNDLMNYSPLIYAKSVKNIAITGKGILNGNADTTTWWPWKGNDRGGWNKGDPSQNTDRNRLVEMANEGVPYEQRIFGEGHYIRVNFIQLIESENILIEGITIVNSPMWEINPVLCKNITVRGITVNSHGPNNDGCDPESCKDVLIEDCSFDTGDDCVAIKSGREEDGRRVNVPSENIIIRNCRMKEGHGGVVIGSEISGGCRNVFIENCTMDSPNLDRALRIKSNSLRGGLVENIYMRNVTIGQVKQAVFLVNLFYAEGDVGNFAPVVRNIYLDHVTSQKSQYALYIKGYERSPVSNIHITDCRFNGVMEGNVLSNVENLNFSRSYINNNIITEGLFEFENQETNNYSGYEESNNTNP